METPFHDGELEAQRLAGESERARTNGRGISTEIVRGALRFIAQQPFFVAATLDAGGRPWASMVAGEPGFVQAPSARELAVDASRVTFVPGELRAHLAGDERIGLLFIEPATRRRLRVNGTARLLPDGGLDLSVLQSFPNCPQYIRPRAFAGGVSRGNRSPRRSNGTSLLPELAERIHRADTFFVASRGLDGVLDVSHRGGDPGFVAPAADGTLRIPDYPGNSMFNTFGNLLRDPRAGLLFADLESGDVLQLTGRAALDFADRSQAGGELATGRAWTFAPEEWRLGLDVLPFRLVRTS